MKKFKILADKLINVGNVTTAFKAGAYETEDEAEIKALSGAKGVFIWSEGDSSSEESNGQQNDDGGEDSELLQLRAEYKAKLGKEPRKNTGKDKLKALIADFDKQQEA